MHKQHFFKKSIFWLHRRAYLFFLPASLEIKMNICSFQSYMLHVSALLVLFFATGTTTTATRKSAKFVTVCFSIANQLNKVNQANQRNWTNQLIKKQALLNMFLNSKQNEQSKPNKRFKPCFFIHLTIITFKDCL